MIAPTNAPELELVGNEPSGDRDDFPAAIERPQAPKWAAPAGNRNPSLPPVILLGGENNVLSVAHSLSKAGVTVYAINRPEVSAARSRYIILLSTPGDRAKVETWRDYLLSPASDFLKGAVVLCMSDEAIKLVVENWTAFSARYVTELGPPEMRVRLLDKLSTYECASACGVDHPRFWRLTSSQDLADIARTCRYPVILKPRLSQQSRQIRAKYLRADNAEALNRQFARCEELGVSVVAMEFIPGGDDCYCSYYTYIDETGAPLFHFTKRLLRRHPENEGGATYHITDWSPEVAEAGLRLFRSVGLRGLGNIEFKRDPRDGRLQLIEVNARFTNGNAAVMLSGIDLALLTYAQLAKLPFAPPRSYRRGVVLWDPIPDFLAFRKLHARGEITLTQWLRQVARADATPIYDLRDPLPGLHHLAMMTAMAARLSVGWARGLRRPPGAPLMSTAPNKRRGKP
jgi:predicted ATP-grasp superfamily ATP-dependent carboligase